MIECRCTLPPPERRVREHECVLVKDRDVSSDTTAVPKRDARSCRGKVIWLKIPAGRNHQQQEGDGSCRTRSVPSAEEQDGARDEADDRDAAQEEFRLRMPAVSTARAHATTARPQADAGVRWTGVRRGAPRPDRRLRNDYESVRRAVVGRPVAPALQSRADTAQGRR